MEPLILQRGHYLGETVRCRAMEGVSLTLTEYEPNRWFTMHVHEHPGLFLLLGGDHREIRRQGSEVQRTASVVYHATSEPHATELGPRGMLGLNISFHTAWLEKLDLHEGALAEERVRMPGVEFAVLKLALAGLCADTPPEDLEGLAIETVSEMTPPERDTLSPRWLLRAVDAIEEGFRERIGLSWLAKRAGVSPVHFARVFRQHQGCSVQEYLQQLRLTEAFRLVAEGESLGMAAALAGFSDQAHLSRLYRARFGSTPAHMKRLLLQVARNRHVSNVQDGTDRRQ